MVKAVVFDLFGTLIYLQKNSKPLQRLFSQLPSNERQALRERCMTERIGNSAEYYAELAQFTAEDEVSHIQKLLVEDVLSVKPFVEALSVLEALKSEGARLGVISNLATPYTACLSNLGLDRYFDSIIYSCQAGLKKPELGIYQMVLQALEIHAPNHALMVGDNYRNDVKGSQAAGMRGLHLRRGVDSHLLQTNEICSLTEVLLHI